MYGVTSFISEISGFSQRNNSAHELILVHLKYKLTIRNACIRQLPVLSVYMLAYYFNYTSFVDQLLVW